MKNLKKIAALVIVLAMALSSVAFAGYTDVATDAGYAEAVEVMSALGLLKGYEDGTFGPDKTITRAEFAAVIVRALGMEDAAAGAVANTIFTDVTSAHWGAGYVQIANQQGIINGYGDGTFGPDDEVTYEQAVKMIVCSLGYGVKFAGVANAYPSAYLSQANTSGITVGATGKIGEKATRAVVAKLVYNALDVKLMEQTGFGTETKFEEVDKTLLSSRLNVAKAEATVAGLYFDPESADKININIDKIGDIYADTFEIETGEDDLFVAAEAIPERGYSCVAYIDCSGDESDRTILAIVPKSGKNNTLVLEGANTKDAKASASELTYFKNNADVDTSDVKIKLDGAKVYVNKNAEALADMDAFYTNWKKGLYNEITLIDNDNDNKYEYIYVTAYESFVIDEINEKKNRIRGDETVTLDPEAEDYIFTIKDAAGKELAFADIKVGDVCNIFTSTSEGYTLKEVVITNEKVEGTVTEWNPATSKYTIGDKEYLGTADEYNVSDTGVFTIDMYGKIIDFEINGSNRKFGMLYQIYADDSGVDTEAKALILTAEGEFVSFPFSKKTDVDKKDYTKDEAVSKLVAAADPKLVVYTVNSSNELTKLYTNPSDIDADYSLYTDKTAKYDATAEDLKFVSLVDSSVVLTCKDDTWAKSDRANKYGITSKAYFADEEEYTYTAIANEDDEVIIAIVFGAEAQVDKASLAMYVTSVGDATTTDGDDAIRVKGYVDGELVTVIVPLDVDGDDTDKITVGSMIQFSGEGEAIAVKVLADAAAIKEAAKGTTTLTGDEKEDLFVAYGKVEKFVKNKVYFKGGDTATFEAGFETALIKLNDDGSVKKVYAASNFAANDIEVYDEAEDVYSDDILYIVKYDGEEIGAFILDVKADTEL